MARMIPESVHPDTKSSAEIAFFDLLKNAQKSENWCCLHSLALGKHVSQRSGEIDFLLITDKGVFVLEVKGGRVRRENGGWIYTDRHGNEWGDARGPFIQARNAMFSLEERISSHFGRDSRLANLLFGYGVVTPDCLLRTHLRDNSGGECEELVYDALDRRKPLWRYVERLVQNTREMQTRKRFSPKESDRADLIRFLRGDFDAVVPLSVFAERSLIRIRQLSVEQFEQLDAFSNYSRTLVEGAAGTGKSVLALELARRLSWQNKSVLLLCYNKNLATYLSTFVLHENEERITVSTIHSYLHQLISQSSLRDKLSDIATQPLAKQFRDHYPVLAWEAAVESFEDSLDAIIIDEAQDVLTESILDVLDVVLKNGLEGGVWSFFLDSNNQAALYNTFEESAYRRLQYFGSTCFLTKNFRNTRPIAIETKMLATPERFASSAIDGQSVEYIWWDSPKQLEGKIHKLLIRLIGKESISPNKITVLTPRRTRDFYFNDIVLQGPRKRFHSSCRPRRLPN